METLKIKVLYENHFCDVVEHTDEECTRSFGDFPLAPASHGFVNLYLEGTPVAWCGKSWAEERGVLFRELTPKRGGVASS